MTIGANRFTRVYLLTDDQGFDVDGYRWEKHTVCNNACVESLYMHPAIAVLLNPLYERLENDNLAVWKGTAKGATPDGIGRFKATGLALVDRIVIPVIPSFRQFAFALLSARRVYSEHWFVRMTDEWLSGAEVSCDTIIGNRSLADEVLSTVPHHPALASMIYSTLELSRWLSLGIHTTEDETNLAEQVAESIELAFFTALKLGQRLDLIETWVELQNLLG
jgi:hypothetical protein